MEDLEGDGTVVPEVVGQIHHRHPASAQLALQRVAVTEGIGQRVRRCGHGVVVGGWCRNVPPSDDLVILSER